MAALIHMLIEDGKTQREQFSMHEQIKIKKKKINSCQIEDKNEHQVGINDIANFVQTPSY